MSIDNYEDLVRDGLRDFDQSLKGIPAKNGRMTMHSLEDSAFNAPVLPYTLQIRDLNEIVRTTASTNFEASKANAIPIQSFFVSIVLPLPLAIEAARAMRQKRPDLSFLIHNPNAELKEDMIVDRHFVSDLSPHDALLPSLVASIEDGGEKYTDVEEVATPDFNKTLVVMDIEDNAKGTLRCREFNKKKWLRTLKRCYKIKYIRDTLYADMTLFFGELINATKNNAK